jgi:hypothetical protein
VIVRIAITFFATIEPKKKGGSLREGTYLQALALAYQFSVLLQTFLSFDDSGSHSKHSRVLMMVAPTLSALKL